MQLTMGNIGPIRTATVDLHPLNVLIGPNNSGKSIFATGMYAAWSRAAADYAVRRVRLGKHFSKIPDERAYEASAYVFEMLEEGRTPQVEEIPDVIKDIFTELLHEIMHLYSRGMVTEFERIFGMSLMELRRRQKRLTKGTISVRSWRPTWSIGFEISSRGVTVDVSPPPLSEVWPKAGTNSWKRIKRRTDHVQGLPRTYLLREMATEIARNCFNKIPYHTKYLPAARSGLLQSHKTLAASMVRRASMAGMEELKIPAMSGVVVDFLGELLELETRNSSNFTDEAAQLERDILSGTVRLEDDAFGYPEIIYTQGQGDYPLARTSSMISEIAPIVVYLRHILSRHDHLVIEEPEAHLHPASQTALARCICRLVNKGLRVSLTTHSEFFLQQLNNAIIASAIPEPEADEMGFDLGMRLPPSKVGAYLFEPTANGTEVHALEVSPDAGISQNSFSEVEEKLYGESVVLSRRLEEDK
ncbi:AAA family ATPase [Streptomyces sp. NPDC004539]|uniref:AAA family ATPase n=1 Tax=Streptomyces sp. NPDC004539 TaxID=3154280 RepID=UPI0033A4AF81